MDADLYRWINRLADRTTWAHSVFRANADLGIVVFAGLLVLAYVHGRHRNDLATVVRSVWAGAAALVALGIGQLIGGAVNRTRPYNALANVHLLVDRTADFSFPSDHATVAGAVAAGLLLTHRRVGIVAAVLAAGMAFTRVYVGAHYPADVLAGLALGAMVAVVGERLSVPLLTRVAGLIARSPLRPLVLRRETPSVGVTTG